MTVTERGLALAVVTLIAFAGFSWLASMPHSERPPRIGLPSLTDVWVAPAESINAASRLVAETDPFRLDRRPSSIVYRPELEGVAPPPKPPKPTLVLEGLVGKAALLDGIPGRPATTVMRVGDTLGGLRIRRVTRDTVVVSGADTLWRLTVRQTWQ